MALPRNVPTMVAGGGTVPCQGAVPPVGQLAPFSDGSVGPQGELLGQRQWGTRAGLCLELVVAARTRAVTSRLCDTRAPVSAPSCTKGTGDNPIMGDAA